MEAVGDPDEILDTSFNREDDSRHVVQEGALTTSTTEVVDTLLVVAAPGIESQLLGHIQRTPKHLTVLSLRDLGLASIDWGVLLPVISNHLRWLDVSGNALDSLDQLFESAESTGIVGPSSDTHRLSVHEEPELDGGGQSSYGISKFGSSASINLGASPGSMTPQQRRVLQSQSKITSGPGRAKTAVKPSTCVDLKQLWYLDISRNPKLAKLPHFAVYIPALGLLNATQCPSLEPDHLVQAIRGLVLATVTIDSQKVSHRAIVEATLGVLSINGRPVTQHGSVEHWKKGELHRMTLRRKFLGHQPLQEMLHCYKDVARPNHNGPSESRRLGSLQNSKKLNTPEVQGLNNDGVPTEGFTKTVASFLSRQYSDFWHLEQQTVKTEIGYSFGLDASVKPQAVEGCPLFLSLLPQLSAERVFLVNLLSAVNEGCVTVRESMHPSEPAAAKLRTRSATIDGSRPAADRSVIEKSDALLLIRLLLDNVVQWPAQSEGDTFSPQDRREMLDELPAKMVEWPQYVVVHVFDKAFDLSVALTMPLQVVPGRGFLSTLTERFVPLVKATSPDGVRLADIVRRLRVAFEPSAHSASAPLLLDAAGGTTPLSSSPALTPSSFNRTDLCAKLQPLKPKPNLTVHHAKGADVSPKKLPNPQMSHLTARVLSPAGGRGRVMSEIALSMRQHERGASVIKEQCQESRRTGPQAGPSVETQPSHEENLHEQDEAEGVNGPFLVHQDLPYNHSRFLARTKLGTSCPGARRTFKRADEFEDRSGPTGFGTQAPADASSPSVQFERAGIQVGHTVCFGQGPDQQRTDPFVVKELLGSGVVVLAGNGRQRLVVPLADFLVCESIGIGEWDASHIEVEEEKTRDGWNYINGSASMVHGGPPERTVSTPNVSAFGLSMTKEGPFSNSRPATRENTSEGEAQAQPVVRLSPKKHRSAGVKQKRLGIVPSPSVLSFLRKKGQHPDQILSRAVQAEVSTSYFTASQHSEQPVQETEVQEATAPNVAEMMSSSALAMSCAEVPRTGWSAEEEARLAHLLGFSTRSARGVLATTSEIMRSATPTGAVYRAVLSAAFSAPSGDGSRSNSLTGELPCEDELVTRIRNQWARQHRIESGNQHTRESSQGSTGIDVAVVPTEEDPTPQASGDQAPTAALRETSVSVGLRPGSALGNSGPQTPLSRPMSGFRAQSGSRVSSAASNQSHRSGSRGHSAMHTRSAGQFRVVEGGTPHPFTADAEEELLRRRDNQKTKTTSEEVHSNTAVNGVLGLGGNSGQNLAKKEKRKACSATLNRMRGSTMDDHKGQFLPVAVRQHVVTRRAEKNRPGSALL